MPCLFAEYTYMANYTVLFSIVLLKITGVPTTIAFVVSAVTSILCGWIGTIIAVYTTAERNWKSGFEVAIHGGCVMGLSLVSIGMLALFALIEVFSDA